MSSPQAGETLLKKIDSQAAVIGIIGLGYVGLPLARTFIAAGFKVLGFDVDAKKVDRIAAGESYIGHIPSEWIAECVAAGTLAATADMSRLSEADAIIICVPTPLSESRDPDLRYIESTARQIATALRPGQLVVLESTTYPGTTRDVVLPILNERGLKEGVDFFLAYSPEREDPGNAKFSTARIPKVVGGIDPFSQRLAAAMYGKVVSQVISVSSCEAAEACKILENVYRAVNIAMVNEIKILFDRIGLDVWEVIDAAKSKPFGFQAFYPGPGLGGHCIPIDPFYLSWLARKHEGQTRFIELAGEINAGMPHWVIEKTMFALNEAGKPLKGSDILVLGVAYKKDVDDPRESPSFKIMELLRARGANITYHDPHIPTLPAMRHYDTPNLSSQPLTPEFLSTRDAAIVVTDHTSVDYVHILRHCPLIIDTRNAMRAAENSSPELAHRVIRA